MNAVLAFAGQWGDMASIAGLAISLVGFGFTLVGVRRSRSAAEAAASAAEQTRSALLQNNAIVELSAAMTAMDEIKRLQREGAWHILPDRYSSLRASLIRIRSAGGSISAEDGSALSAAISQFGELEQRIERALAKKTTPSNPAKFNEIVSGHLDSLQIVLTSLQKKLGS